jgi:hypothetical protein
MDQIDQMLQLIPYFTCIFIFLGWSMGTPLISGPLGTSLMGNQALALSLRGADCDIDIWWLQNLAEATGK